MSQPVTNRLFPSFRKPALSATLTGATLLFAVGSASANYYPPEYYPEYYDDQPANYYQVDPGPNLPPALQSYPQDYRAPVIVNERPVGPVPGYTEPQYAETYFPHGYAGNAPQGMAPPVIETAPGPNPVVPPTVAPPTVTAPASDFEPPLIRESNLTQDELDALERRQRELAHAEFQAFQPPAQTPPPPAESGFTEDQANETARRLAEAQATFSSRTTTPPPSMPLGDVSKPDVYRPVVVEPEPEPVVAPAPPVYRPPVVGSFSLIEQVQRSLNDRGYSVGAVDGVMGSRTRAALGRFQSANGLPVTRTTDSATLQALGVYFAGSPPASAASLPTATDYTRYK